jgi:hypothetical protein
MKAKNIKGVVEVRPVPEQLLAQSAPDRLAFCRTRDI